MQKDGTSTLSLIVGAVQSNSKETSSNRRYSAAARWRACLLSITCYYVTWHLVNVVSLTQVRCTNSNLYLQSDLYTVQYISIILPAAYE